MKQPKTRGAAIAAFCRGCIHDAGAFGTWREQVAACPATDCSLWRFRPLQDAKSCPDWIKSHNPADLPDGWTKVTQPDAVRIMRGWIADKAAHRAVQAGGVTSTAKPRVDSDRVAETRTGAAL